MNSKLLSDVDLNNRVVLHESDIDKAILSGVNVNKSLVRHLENVLIEKALIKTKGNQRAAAELIGLSRTKLGQRARQLAKCKTLEKSRDGY